MTAPGHADVLRTAFAAAAAWCAAGWAARRRRAAVYRALLAARAGVALRALQDDSLLGLRAVARWCGVEEGEVRAWMTTGVRDDCAADLVVLQRVVAILRPRYEPERVVRLVEAFGTLRRNRRRRHAGGQPSAALTPGQRSLRSPYPASTSMVLDTTERPRVPRWTVRTRE